MKFCKVRLIYNDNPQSSEGFGQLAKELKYEMVEMPLKNSEEVLNFLERLRAVK